MEKKQCSICGRFISKTQFERHFNKCKRLEDNNNSKLLQCPFCNKNFNSKNSLNPHIWAKHTQEGQKKVLNFTQNNINKKGWNKGLTKETDERLRNIGNTISALHENGKAENDRRKRKYSLEERQQWKNNLSNRYKNGELNSGRGKTKYSYIIYKDKKYLLRSTYEFIFAYYLYYNNIDFTYQDKNVYWNGKKYLSDFCVKDKLYEIKGWHTSQIIENINNAFTNNGFSIEFLYKDDINNLKKILINSGVNIEWLLQQIIIGSNNKNYFIFNFNTAKPEKILEINKNINKEKQLQQRLYNIIVKKMKHDNKNQILNENIKKIINSDIDFSKFGWVSKVAKILEITPQKVNQWMKRNMLEFYNTKCFKRK